MPKQLTNWLDEFVENGADPSDVIDWPENSGGGTSYSAGNGITITNHTISIDEQIVALKQEEFSGDYNDLENKPTIPTLTSQLQNDSGYITGVSWDDVTNKPTITNVEANTGETTTATLTDLKVGDTVYGISGGGSGSEYYAGTGINIDENNYINLDLEIDSYDSVLYINGSSGETQYIGASIYANQGAGDEYLTSLQIGDTTYNLPDYAAGVGIEIGDPLSGETTRSISLDENYIVVGNPADEAQTTLSKIAIGNTVYSIPGGSGGSYTAGTGIDITNDEISVDNTVAMKTDITSVEANSQETPTDTLNNLKIGSTVYDFNTTGVTNIYDHTTSNFDLTYNTYRDPGLHVVHSSQFITIKTGKDSSGNVLSVTCGQSKYVLVFIANSDNSIEGKTYWYAFWGHASNKISYGYYDRTKGSANGSGYINTIEMNRLENQLTTYTVSLELTDGTNFKYATVKFTMPYSISNFNEDSFKTMFGQDGFLQPEHSVMLDWVDAQTGDTIYKITDLIYDLQTGFSDLDGNMTDYEINDGGFSFTTYSH